MTLSVYLQRKNLDAGMGDPTFERLYIPVDNGRGNAQVKANFSALPGNDADKIAGLSGEVNPNIIINQGTVQLVKTFSGTFTDFPDATELFPDLTAVSDTEHMDSSSRRQGGSGGWLGGNTITGTINGFEWFATLFDFFMDQALTGAGQDFNYTDFKLGWPDWNDEGTREWEGQISNLTYTRVAGEEGQVAYTIQFQIGTNPE